MKVWLVEIGEYEQRAIAGVYTSREGAIAGHKATYPEVTDWREDEDGVWDTSAESYVRVWAEDVLADGQPWYVADADR